LTNLLVDDKKDLFEFSFPTNITPEFSECTVEFNSKE